MGYGLLCGWECGAEEQTIDHVVLQRPLNRPPLELHCLAVLDEETIEWLLNTVSRSSVDKQWLQQLAQKKNNYVDIQHVFLHHAHKHHLSSVRYT